MYTFVKFDDLINENNEIEAPESLKNLQTCRVVKSLAPLGTKMKTTH